MSHRLTVETKITDREAATDALRANKITFRENGPVITLQTQPYNGTTIDLRTGVVESGDVDFARNSDGSRVSHAQIGILRQWYAEAKYRLESAKEGVTILDRTEIMEEGQKVVLLTWQTG